MVKRLTCKQRHYRRWRRTKGGTEKLGLGPDEHLSDERVRWVLESCRKHKGGRAAVTLMLIESYLYTGLRAIELLGLTLHDIPPWDGHPNIVRVPAEFAKGGTQRTIQVNPKIVDKWGAFVTYFHMRALQQIASKNPDKSGRGLKTPLFLNERGLPMEYGSVYGRLKTVKNRCGFDFRPHICRHTYGTKLYGATKDLRYVQRQLGHKSPNSTALYEHTAKYCDNSNLAGLDWG